MSEFVVYVLSSSTTDKLYKGYTSNLVLRMLSHNKLGKGWTARYRPWRVVHVEFYGTKNAAISREKWLKTGVGREWLKVHAQI